MSSDFNEGRIKSDLRIKRAVILVVTILLLLIFALISVLINRELEDSIDHSKIYGIWDEQNVPNYAQDIFAVREEGVYVNERVVDADYSFDGSTLIYEYDEKEYIYVIRNHESTVLQRVAPLHYESTFHLRDKYQEVTESALLE